MPSPRNKPWAILCLLLAAPCVWAAKDEELPAAEPTPISSGGAELPIIEAVDTPTADILDPVHYQTDFRFYDEGGVLSRLLISPLKRVGLGVQFDVQRVVGGGEPHLVQPSLWFKLRFFDGTDYVPAFALGYDNQGYLWRNPPKDFIHQERGLYLVMAHEIFVPNFYLHGGVNLPKVNDDAKVFGFFGATYRLIPAFALLMEYDNIRNAPENRFNVGGRFFVTPFFSVDLAARNIGRKNDRGAERIVRLAYTARFPI